MTAITSPRILLLMSPATYRAAAFLSAAEHLGVDAISVLDMPERLKEEWNQTLVADFANAALATSEVVDIARREGVSAVLSVDDSATELAARVARELGFAHNAPEAAVAARDKLVMRSMLANGGVKCPAFLPVPANEDPGDVAGRVPYPCVVKPLRLSGSRGVIRADDPEAFVRAFRQLQGILTADGGDLDRQQILVEEYLPGEEVAVEGLMTDGELHVLAIFDKPDPLVGPYFEETIYVTPSRHSPQTQTCIARECAAAAEALGLRNGPIHAELRVNDRGAWLLEVAGRSIGGLCSTILSFGTGMSLEELILRHAVGMEIPSFDRNRAASGVMMIPIPRKGILREIAGIDAACSTPRITGVEITAKMNYPILPLPEGASYLGFIFAQGETPEEVEQALRDAHDRLEIRIEPTLAMTPVGASGTS